jgi:hypothetical protein
VHRDAVVALRLHVVAPDEQYRAIRRWAGASDFTLFPIQHLTCDPA